MTASSFGDRLRHYRVAAGLTQEELAERAGVSVRGLSDLERGARGLPRKDTLQLLLQALDLTPAEQAALMAAARRPPPPAARRDRVDHHALLPRPLTPLIGRERELAELSLWLGTGTARLVTLTGIGGTGKTRLALEVGARLEGKFADGVAFVDLTPLTEASLVVPTIASVLGVRERLDQSLRETLARFLTAKQLLLIMDNCERVLDAVPDFVALLAACPHLAILATSREALRVRGERIVPLAPLPLPSADHLPPIEELVRVPAVTLFVERATARQPSFVLTADNAAAVAAICRRLDGLPLAIELAAAWIRVLSPAALLGRLERRLPLLTGGGRDLPARQRTMRDAIAWSHDLLATEEQTVFQRLAIFTGGWTLEAAETVCGGPEVSDVLAGLEALVTASLVLSEERTDGERRFGMLETVREFGLEQLAAGGAAEALGRRHADYYLALAQTGGANLAGAAPGEWLTLLDTEQGNLRTALTWLRDRTESALGLRLAATLGGFWRLHSANTEGRTWLEIFLAQPAADSAPVADRIVALRWAGELAGLQGDPAIAEARLRESLALARTAGDTRSMAGVLGAIGSALFQSGDVAGCLDPFAEATALSRQLGDLRQTAFLLAYLAVAVGHQGDLAGAEALLSESEELFHALGDAHSFEASLLPLAQGLVALMGGAYDRSEKRFEAALAIGQAIEAKAILSATLAGLGEVDLARGQFTAAARRYRDGLLQGWEGAYPLGIAWNLRGIARIGSRHDQAESVARLVGTLDAFVGALRALPTGATLAYEADVATVRAALGGEAFAVAREAGRARSLEKAVTEAIQLVEDFVPSPVPERSIAS